MSGYNNANLDKVRDQMRRFGVSAVIIPGTDPHLSEFVGEHWKVREWVTGFTGSNGTAVITLDSAAMWTDSRYFLQAEAQLKDSGFVMKRENGVEPDETIAQWLCEELNEDDTLAIDGRLFSVLDVESYEAFCAENGFLLATDFAPADKVWTDRPARPSGKVKIHDLKFAGESVESKIERVLQIVEYSDADALFTNALDEIGWLFNLRGSDIAGTPVAVAFAYISEQEKVLFIDDCKITDEVKKHLATADVKTKEYGEVLKWLGTATLNHTVIIDPQCVTDAIANAITGNKIYVKSIIAELKAIKNDVQIEGFRKAMLRDGVAMTRAMRWIEENVANGCVTEMTVAEKFAQERSKEENYVEESFDLIAGYAEHGAIVHYCADAETNATLKPDNLLLIDTGGHYWDGTTDITRTFSLGNPTEQQKHDYTLVLKGHLALSRIKFPVATRGAQLDVLARMFMWNEKINFMHGTGHGVGQCLSVHEGPQGIRMQENPTILMPGMITSNEPGIYKAGEYGIRIENLILTVVSQGDNGFGEFLEFETLTLFPYDLNLIDVAMLDSVEKAQINAYHKRVRELLSDHLGEADAKWLENKTAEIK